MKSEVRKVFKCDHCNKMYQVERACVRHELMCKKNPEYMRPCHNCNNIEKVTETIILAGVEDMWGNESERTVSVLFCKKRDCFIYPPSVAVKGNAFDMGDKPNEEMPKECEFFEQKYYL